MLVRFVDQHRLRRTVFSPKNDPPKVVVDSEEKAATNKSSKSSRPRLHLSMHALLPFDPYQYRCNDKRSPDCLNKTHAFSGHVLNEFKRSLRNSPATEGDENSYHIDYSELENKNVAMVQPVCLVMAAKVRALRRKDGPLRTHTVGKSFPRRKLFGRHSNDNSLSNNTCVIVSSAGSLIGSGLGRFIGEYFRNKSKHYTHCKFTSDQKQYWFSTGQTQGENIISVCRGDSQRKGKQPINSSSKTISCPHRNCGKLM